MKIEVGKYYRTRDGRKVGPITCIGYEIAYWDEPHDGEFCCYPDGRIKFDGTMCEGDLIAEWQEEDNPVLWRDMTPEQKGALLLAHHEGKVIETFDPPCAGLGWVPRPDPAFDAPDLAYRVKPAPVTKPSIDWSHVAEEFDWLATDKDGMSCLFKEKPHKHGTVWDAPSGSSSVATFASYLPGTCDWQDSLVQRPGKVKEARE